MFYVKPLQILITCASCLTATQSTAMGVHYFSDSVELVMLDPATATFECDFNDLPARIQIDGNTRADVAIGFELPRFGFEAPPQDNGNGTEITIRRGNDSIVIQYDSDPSDIASEPTDQDDDEPTLSPDDWHVTVTSQIDFCVGLATLEIANGSLDVHVQIGQYEANIQNIVNFPEDLRAGYYVPNSEPISGFLRRNSDPGRVDVDKNVGSVAVEGGRDLGRLSFFIRPTDVTYINITDPDGITEETWLTFAVTLVEAVPVSD